MKREAEWDCEVCGYIHIGLEPPDECPQCGAAKEMFQKMDSELERTADFIVQADEALQGGRPE